MNPFSGLPPFSYDELQKNVGNLVYPNGIQPDGMTQEQMFRQGVGQLGAGMLANANKNPMQALGMSYLEAQNQGLNNARQIELAESMRSKRKEREDREKRRTALGNYLREYPNLPENIRKMAEADPEGVFNWMQDRYQTVGGRGIIDTMTGQPTQFAGMDSTNWSTSGQNVAVKEDADGNIREYPVQFGDNGKMQVLDPETGQPIQDTRGFKFMGPESLSEARARGRENLEAPKARARVQQFQQQGKVIRQQINMLFQNQEALAAATGMIDARLPSYQQAMQNARDIIFGLESMLSTRALQQMRESSPTGGAVGQVTEAEWGRLAASIANLKQTQGTPQFMEQLQLLWKQLEEAEMIAAEQYQNTHGQYVQRRPELAIPTYEMPPMPDALTNFTSPGASGGADLQLPPGVVIKSKDGQPYQPPAPQQQAPQRPVAPWGIP